MNIFYLDESIDCCAQAHFDCHVVKMILESAQILCTVCIQYNMNAPYRATHQKHPCTLWAGQALDNWLWLKKLGLALNQEYQFRFGHTKSHRSASVIDSLQSPPLPHLGITERPQAMPVQYRIPGDSTGAYRQYYRHEKQHLFAYTKRKPPAWLVSASQP